MKKILIAGIGNIFQGDDAFGCEVARQLGAASLPEGVQVTDFGIRGYDLAYALNSDYDAIILVDAAPRGGDPGTIYLLELDPNAPGDCESAPDAHSMTPVAVIAMAKSLGGVNGRLYLVGCEPAVLEADDGEMGLSEKVAAAAPDAVKMIESLLGDLRREEQPGAMADTQYLSGHRSAKSNEEARPEHESQQAKEEEIQERTGAAR